MAGKFPKAEAVVRKAFPGGAAEHAAYVKQRATEQASIATKWGTPKTSAIHAAPNTSPGLWQHIYIGLTEWETFPIPGLESLADTGSFTVTGGYAKVNNIEVPLRVALTVFAGYDPITATVPLLLDRLGQNPPGEANGTELAVEEGCQFLEWCAGRGMALKGHDSPAAMGQPPPEVELSSNAPDGNPTRLIPFGYQFNHNNPSPPRWIITGLAWGENIRDRKGNRQRQRVVVTLTQSITNPLVEEYDAASARKRQTSSKGWKPYTVRNRTNDGETPLEIVRFVLGKRGAEANTLASEIRERAVAAGIKCPNVNYTIKSGKTISIPSKP